MYYCLFTTHRRQIPIKLFNFIKTLEQRKKKCVQKEIQAHAYKQNIHTNIFGLDQINMNYEEGKKLGKNFFLDVSIWCSIFVYPVYPIKVN